MMDMRNASISKLVIAALLFLALPGSTYAASESVAPRGVITIAVRDLAGHPLPGAGVTLTLASPQSEKPQIEIAPASGMVSFSHLAAGKYTLKCELSGFFTTTLTDIPIELDRSSPRLSAEIVVVLAQGPIWS